jgi:pimeloyl-ACP methyl ester carboxylesterase
MDPRGIENSSQVRCTLPVITPETTLFPRTEQQFQQLLKHNREVGLNSVDQAGELVRHIDTVNVARDHVALRLALGENKINWLGISYGTQLAANYAERMGWEVVRVFKDKGRSGYTGELRPGFE